MEYTRRLELRIDRATLEKLDVVRGDMTRSAWLREKIDWHHNTGKQSDEKGNALRQEQ